MIVSPQHAAWVEAQRVVELERRRCAEKVAAADAVLARVFAPGGQQYPWRWPV